MVDYVSHDLRSLSRLRLRWGAVRSGVDGGLEPGRVVGADANHLLGTTVVGVDDLDGVEAPDLVAPASEAGRLAADEHRAAEAGPPGVPGSLGGDDPAPVDGSGWSDGAERGVNVGAGDLGPHA